MGSELRVVDRERHEDDHAESEVGVTDEQFRELMQAVARIDSRMDAKFAALEHRLTSIEQQLLQRIDDVADRWPAGPSSRGDT